VIELAVIQRGVQGSLGIDTRVVFSARAVDLAIGW
jgi:hypothetical protein